MSQAKAQYLILHKVRGAPAFDIAEPTRIGNEDGWVLCTCGHQAYPWAWWPIDPARYMDEREALCDPRWASWPDHYQTKAEARPKAPKAQALSTDDLANALGL